MNGVFEQGGSMNFDGAASNGGLSDQFGLDFRGDVNGNSHANPSSISTVTPPSSEVKKIAQHNVLYV
jgi:hypothetical protein